MSLIGRMDDFVKRIGLYPGITGHGRPRHTRWLPIVVLTLAIVGFGLHVADPDRSAFIDGSGLVMLAFVVSPLFALLGPLRQPTLDEPLDEREKLLRTRAFSAGAMAVAALAIVGALLFSLAGYLGTWTPRTADDWRTICFALVAVFHSVPPLHASWTTRPIPEEA